MAITVLIVDDHPSFRASARAILEADGFTIVGEAEGGASGLVLPRRLRPDVVLLPKWHEWLPTLEHERSADLPLIDAEPARAAA